MKPPTSRSNLFVSPTGDAVRRFINALPTELQFQFGLITYNALEHVDWTTTKQLIFTGQDQLPPRDVLAASRILSTLRFRSKNNCPQALNPPTRPLHRLQQLERLFALGVNNFRAWRLPDAIVATNIRYPIFLRSESPASQPISPLISSKLALDHYVRQLLFSNIDLQSVLAIEWCCNPDARGLYRKYSAFCVGSTIFPAHLYFSTHWWIKGLGLFKDSQCHQDEERYLAENPHQKDLLYAFEACRIDFGRVDYSIVNNRLQVYEINLDPAIISPRATPHRNTQISRLLAEHLLTLQSRPRNIE